MQRIDAHQHFWKFDRGRDSWITDEMKIIRTDFLPQHLEPSLKENGFDGCVVVQSDQSEMENAFQLANAENYDFIKGIVGWVDLQAENIEGRLEFYRGFKKMKGFRHVLQGEPRRDLMLKPAFMNGISKLNDFGFTYDILILPDQLIYIEKLVRTFPGQKFVIDHLAKPYIRKGKIDDWEKDIKAVASNPNVYCKISGMVTEADWKEWKREDFKPYIKTIVNCFGTDRILFGSDWPVCLVAASYREVVGIVKDYFSEFTSYEQEKIFGANAIEFYNL
jgi:L-fuconolactonase